MAVGLAATGAFGTRVLEGLAERCDVAWVLTRPDRPRGRGRKLGAPPAKEAAERLGLPVLQPARLGPDVALDADTVVLADYGALVPTALLERHLWLNVHPSLLPRWRGAAPVERALMAGDPETGVTIIRLAEELDAGPIAAQRAFAVGPDDDAETVYERAAETGVELLDELLGRDTIEFAPQPVDGVTYAEKIRPDERELDLSDPVDADRRVRALTRHGGARALLHGRPVTIWRAALEAGELRPLEVQPEGGRRMPYDAWLRGLR